MPTYICKFTDKNQQDYYLEWSTIVDAPITYGMGLDEFKEYYLEEYGKNNFVDLDARLKRVDESGCSARNDNLNGLIGYNRAGPNETCLSYDDLLQKYCIERTG